MFPSTKTFGIPEILKTILEYALATPQDLLIWQRVNKSWQAAIQRSLRVQETLFLKTEACKDVFDNERAVLNPFMNIFSKRMDGDIWLFTSHAFIGKASCPTASYTRMFITSPAVTELEMVVFEEGCEFAMVSGSIAWETGITIGHVADCQMEGTDIYLDLSKIMRMKHTSPQ